MSPYRRNAAFNSGWLLDLPIKKKLYLIIALLIVNIVLVISLGTFALKTLSSIRAAVAGESIWAKAQKTAVYSLGKYALSQDEGAYQDYLAALKIPIAYDRANRELRKAKPDLAVLDQAFIEGGIHPKDVPGVDRLFIQFQNAPHVALAFRTWAGAQTLVNELQNLAQQLRASVISGKATKEELALYVSQIDNLNEKITTLEIQFSSELGEASRWATNFSLWVMIGVSFFIGLLSVGIAFYISGAIVAGVEKISRAASQAALGDLTVRVAIHTKDELGKLADAFNHMAEGLGKLDVLKTEFFANISHEFRTPLTLILGPLEDLLSSPDEKDPQARRSLEIVHRNALRLLKLVNSLLDFSSLEAGRIKALYVPTDMSAFTTELASHFGWVVEKAGLEYVVECQSPPEPLYVDRDMWEKIVFNLLSNAFKFTFEGKISVSLGYDALGVRFEVKDTGTGISEAELPHLFDRFHRVQEARSRTHEGSGIGLSLVKELARLHGGSIEVESTQGKGSTFIVRVPFGSAHLRPDQIAQVFAGELSQAVVRTANAYVHEAALWLPDHGAIEATALVSESSTKKRARILVIDDNADMRTYITRLLVPQWDVEIACDGSEALKSIGRRLPDLVLSDVMLPKMSGFELLERLRQEPATRHLPIILLSARAGEESRIEGIAGGADDYLVKPFSARELIARVNTHLNMSRVREEAAKDASIISRLEAEQKWLESILNLMPIPLLLIEPTTARVTFANRAADLMAGGDFPRNVPIEDYSKTYKLTDEQDRDLPVNESPFVRAARGEKVEGKIVVWHSAAGRLTVLVNADTLAEMYRHPKTVLLAFQDVTTLSQAIQSRDEFLSIASHELRTPITSMRMQLQLAQRELKPEKGIVPPPERLAKLLHIFSLQIDRLTSLVEDLLDVSRIQAGRLSLYPEPCNLSDVLKLVIERLSPHFANAQCPLELNIDEGVTGLWDRKRIESVIVNLITNATKYAPGKPIRISLATREEHGYLTIQDFGPGIAKEKQVKLFERWERAISARNISGLGLGLFISRQIIKAHCGSIDLWSEPGKGSVFTVKIPLRLASAMSGDKSVNFLEAPSTPLHPGEGVAT